jgi:hypothetical protein
MCVMFAGEGLRFTRSGDGTLGTEIWELTTDFILRIPN